MKTDNIPLWQKRIADKKANRMKLDESNVSLFVEVPTEPANRTNMVSGTMRLEWNEVIIHVTDSHTVNLAAELLARLQKLC